MLAAVSWTWGLKRFLSVQGSCAWRRRPRRSSGWRENLQLHTKKVHLGHPVYVNISLFTLFDSKANWQSDFCYLNFPQDVLLWCHFLSVLSVPRQQLVAEDVGASEQRSRQGERARQGQSRKWRRNWGRRRRRRRGEGGGEEEEESSGREAAVVLQPGEPGGGQEETHLRGGQRETVSEERRTAAARATGEEESAVTGVKPSCWASRDRLIACCPPAGWWWWWWRRGRGGAWCLLVLFIVVHS